MALQIRRGAGAPPSTVAGEPAFDTDRGLLYLGNGSNSVLIGGGGYLALPSVVAPAALIDLTGGVLLDVSPDMGIDYSAVANARPGRDIALPTCCSLTVVGPFILDSGLMYSVESGACLNLL